MDGVLRLIRRKSALRASAIALLATALLVPAPAVAKAPGSGDEEVVVLLNDPEDEITGRAWTAELRIRPADLLQRAEDRPAVLILDERTGARQSFPVRQSGDRFTAEVVFPEEGRWAYGAAMGDRFVAGREYTDVTQAATRSDPTLILALSGLLVLGAAALSMTALRHRPAPAADAPASG